MSINKLDTSNAQVNPLHLNTSVSSSVQNKTESDNSIPTENTTTPQNMVVNKSTNISPSNKELSKSELAELLRRINMSFDIFEIQSRFIIDPNGLDELKIEIRNTVTGELIRKIPMTELSDLYQEFKNSVGSIINKLL